MLDYLNSDWRSRLETEIHAPYFQRLMEFVDSERKMKPNAIFPIQEHVFAALNQCSFDQVKVVILGQDPYPTRGHAIGLSFAVSEKVKPLPKSLQNIYRELATDLQVIPPQSGDLSHWAKQGVLLLNSVLTVEEGIPNSHSKKGWEQFTTKIISLLNAEKTGLVYLLWGKNAHEKAKEVDSSANFILKTSHPSPLGFMKSGADFISFFGSKPFTKTNRYLIENNQLPIDWVHPYESKY